MPEAANRHSRRQRSKLEASARAGHPERIATVPRVRKDVSAGDPVTLRRQQLTCDERGGSQHELHNGVDRVRFDNDFFHGANERLGVKSRLSTTASDGVSARRELIEVKAAVVRSGRFSKRDEPAGLEERRVVLRLQFDRQPGDSRASRIDDASGDRSVSSEIPLHFANLARMQLDPFELETTSRPVERLQTQFEQDLRR